MDIFEVRNVEEAVAMATDFAKSGRYNWFRGQVQEWEPASSLERALKRGALHEDLLDDLNRFHAWCSREPELQHLCEPENVDAFYAIRQHFGFPTTYIDFSTSPAIAGFFAADTTTPPEAGSRSVIYCLDTEDFTRFYSKFAASTKGGRAQPVSVDVSNLWRLQAQCGHFLFTDHTWYHVYDMDRIVFPWTGLVTYPGRDQIYPTQKSRLEILLDEFLAQEERRRRAQYFENSGFQKLFVNVCLDSLAEEGYLVDRFSRPLERLLCWPNLATTPAHFNTDELFRVAVGKVIELRLRAHHLAPAAPEQLEAAFRAALGKEPGIRQQAIRWTISELPPVVDASSFDLALRSLWNGVRRLPVGDAVIAEAAKELLRLWHLPDRESADGLRCDAAFTSWKDDAFYVELSWAHLHSRAYCSEKDLLACVDEAWLSALTNGRAFSETVTGALQSTWDPSLIFNFKRFEKLFVTQVVPSQLALRRDAVAYDPGRIIAFSLA